MTLRKANFNQTQYKLKMDFLSAPYSFIDEDQVGLCFLLEHSFKNLHPTDETETGSMQRNKKNSSTAAKIHDLIFRCYRLWIV